MNKDIRHIRKDYRKYSLNIDAMHTNPYIQFCSWFSEVVETENEEANVMVLSTADIGGRPSSRIVLLKEHNEKGYVFYTNYDSRKGLEIEQNPYVSLLFWWADFERQVRIEGRLLKISEKESDAYFYSRPKESQIAAMISNQSQSIQDKQELIEKYQILFEDTSTNAIKRPSNWGGYMLFPERYEFWQGGANRIHDRFLYEKRNDKWTISRLQP